MGRIACAFVARFELAVRARTKPELWQRAVALADLATTRARLIAVSPTAERQGIRAGQPVGEALALCPRLELIAPDPDAARLAETEILAALGQLSPALDADGLGAFFATVDGLQQVYPDEMVLAHRMKEALRLLGYDARLGLADRSLPAWVAARRTSSISRIPPGQDTLVLAEVGIEELALPPPVLERLELLGIRTVGQLMAQPPGTLAARLPEGARLERFCRGDERLAWPTPARIPTTPEELSLDLDTPTEELEPILFLLKSLLDRLLTRVAQTQRGLAELLIVVRLDDRTEMTHRLIPAVATLENRVLMDLLRLWLSSGPLRSAVASVRLVAERTEVVSPSQLGLFQRARELGDDALKRAAARLSAAFGSAAVVRPVVVDTFRPESRVGWVHFGDVHLHSVDRRNETERLRSSPAAPVALRMLSPPEAILWRGHHLRLPGGATVRVVGVDGPHRLSGDWWEASFDRSYFWLTGAKGERFWLYRDEVTTECFYLQAVAD